MVARQGGSRELAASIIIIPLLGSYTPPSPSVFLAKFYSYYRASISNTDLTPSLLHTAFQTPSTEILQLLPRSYSLALATLSPWHPGFLRFIPN